MKYKHNIGLSLMVLAFLWTTDVSAQVMGDIAIHGFGGWAYGKTDNENRYLTGTEDGNYEDVNFSLNLSANLYEKLSMHIQPSYAETLDGSEVGLDYAFAEWYFSDALAFRVGKVKAPFMLATEVYDVGTIRPLFLLPHGVYQELAAEAYKGVGLTGSLYTRGGWDLQYDLYGGKLTLLPKRYLNRQTFQFDAIIPEVNDLLGGRVIVHTPLAGLNAAVSAYTGNVDVANRPPQGQGPQGDRYLFVGTSAEYQTDRVWLRSEYLKETETPEIEIDVVYLEAAYRLTSHWQVAARYEYMALDIPSLASRPIPPSVFDHKEVTLGLNYWLNPNLVVKCSYHRVNGNRLAFPETVMDYLQSLQQGSLEEQTNLILIGVQFSF